MNAPTESGIYWAKINHDQWVIVGIKNDEYGDGVFILERHATVSLEGDLYRGNAIITEWGPRVEPPGERI